MHFLPKKLTSFSLFSYFTQSGESFIRTNIWEPDTLKRGSWTPYKNRQRILKVKWAIPIGAFLLKINQKRWIISGFIMGFDLHRAFKNALCKRGATAALSCVSGHWRSTDVDPWVSSSRQWAFLTSFSGKLALSAMLSPSPLTNLSWILDVQRWYATSSFLMFSSQLAIFSFILHVLF